MYQPTNLRSWYGCFTGLSPRYGTVLDHPIKRVFVFIYGRIRKKLQEMSDKIFAPLTEQEKRREEIRLAEIEERRRRRAGE